MKLLTTSFLTCAVKTCRSSHSASTLHFQNTTLTEISTPQNLDFLRGVLQRVDWTTVRTHAAELGFPNVPEENPLEAEARGEAVSEQVWGDVWRLLVEVNVQEGKMRCEVCEHEYPIKEGIANFLLPSHLV